MNFVICFQIGFKLSSVVHKIFYFNCYPMWLLNFFEIFKNTLICSYNNILFHVFPLILGIVFVSIL